MVFSIEYGASFLVDVCNVVLMVLGANKWRRSGGDVLYGPVGGELVCSELVYCEICRFAVMLLSSKPNAKQVSLS
jgi:hypothetical protein